MQGSFAVFMISARGSYYRDIDGIRLLSVWCLETSPHSIWNVNMSHFGPNFKLAVF